MVTDQADWQRHQLVLITRRYCARLMTFCVKVITQIWPLVIDRAVAATAALALITCTLTMGTTRHRRDEISAPLVTVRIHAVLVRLDRSITTTTGRQV